MRPKTLSPCEIQRTIDEHVSRYGLTVAEALRGLPPLKDVSSGMLNEQLRVLVRKGSLRREKLYGTRACYYSSRAMDPAEPSRATQRSPPAMFSEQAKLRCYAMLSFCRLTKTPRVRLQPSEVSATCPELSRPGLPSGYYAEVAPHGNRIGYASIDSGGYGRWDRIVARVQHCIEYHRGLPGLRRLIEEQRFEFAIITALPQKADRIRDTLGSRHELRGVLLRVCAVPELLYLIAPPRTPARATGNAPK